MTLERIACISIGIAFTSSIASGQQASRQEPANSVIEHRSDSGRSPWRAVSTRSGSGGRMIVIETVEEPDVDGRMAPIHETVTETTRSGSTSAQSRREVFGFGADGRRRLLETTESQQETLPNRGTDAVHSKFTPDLNGRTALTSRTIENTRNVTPAVRQTDTTILLPDLDGVLRHTTRVEYTEHTDPSAVRHESTEQIRDLNGRWLTIERRSGEARQTGASERLEEQTIERLDMNGKVSIVERTVSRGSGTSESEDVVIETHIPSADRWLRSGDGLALSERMHRTTTRTADGGRSTVEEVEGRNLVAPAEPMRVMRRTLTTVRPIGPDRSITNREVFERDVNGRMVRVSAETEDSAAQK